MEIIKTSEGEKLTAVIKGRLDTLTAPQFTEEFDGDLDGLKELVLDFTDVEYLSSAGLRALMSCQKKLKAVDGSLTVKNPNEMVQDVFELTGFDKILRIEKA